MQEPKVGRRGLVSRPRGVDWLRAGASGRREKRESGRDSTLGRRSSNFTGATHRAPCGAFGAHFHEVSEQEGYPVHLQTSLAESP